MRKFFVRMARTLRSGLTPTLARRFALCRDDVMGLFVHLIDARPIDIDPDAAHKRPERRNE